MKKGASHVDWAISMGIFLVYVMLMLIFLRPTSQPEYSGNTLLNTIYSGLKDDAAYTVQKGYLIIKPTITIGEGKNYQIMIKDASKYLSEEWKESEDEELKHLTMFDEELGKIPSEDLGPISFDFVCDEGASCSYETVLDIITRLENNKNNVFWFVYSEEEYTHPTATISYSDAECQEEDPLGARANPCLLNDGPGGREDDFTYEFGMIETYSGFSQEKLNTLSLNTSDELKKKWNFPEDKNFKINITEPEAIAVWDYNKDLEPEQGMNVYVVEEKVWILDKNGYLTPAKIIITIW